MKPWVVQIFWPLMTHSSPSSTALVLRPARSEPASGSEKPWHQAIWPERILGRNSCFCASVPHCRIVGPTRVSPKKSARSGARTRANSSASTTPCIVESPLPPYSCGQVAQIHPPSKSRRGQLALNSARSVADISNGSPRAAGSAQPAGRLSRNQLRISRRNASASASYVNSIGAIIAAGVCWFGVGRWLHFEGARCYRSLDRAVEGAVRRGDHDGAVHRLRRLRRHVPP